MLSSIYFLVFMVSMHYAAGRDLVFPMLGSFYNDISEAPFSLIGYIANCYLCYLLKGLEDVDFLLYS